MEFRNIRAFFWKIPRPEFWTTDLSSIDWSWDRELNLAIDREEKVTLIGGYIIMMGNVEIWVSNYPYSFGYPYNYEKVLPAPWTRKRLFEYLKTVPNNEILEIFKKPPEKTIPKIKNTKSKEKEE